MDVMMGRIRLSVVALSAFITLACGNNPAEIVPPVGKAEILDTAAPFPRIRFGDGLVSENDRCPVTKRKMSVAFPPVYVNGKPIGFC